MYPNSDGWSLYGLGKHGLKMHLKCRFRKVFFLAILTVSKYMSVSEQGKVMQWSYELVLHAWWIFKTQDIEFWCWDKIENTTVNFEDVVHRKNHNDKLYNTTDYKYPVGGGAAQNYRWQNGKVRFRIRLYLKVALPRHIEESSSRRERRVSSRRQIV